MVIARPEPAALWEGHSSQVMTSVNVTFQPSQVLPGEEALCIKNTGCSLAWRRGQRRLPSGKVKNVLRPLDVEGSVSRGEGGVGQAQRV